MTWLVRRLGYTPALVLVSLITLGILAGVLYLRVAITLADALPVYSDAPSFRLSDQLGRSVDSEDLRDTVVLANFVYTNCPDICPLLSVRMQAVQERMSGTGALGTRVQLVSFTVDPARDTPEVLRAYAERYGADPEAWRFLTGPEQELIPTIVEGFLLGVQALPAQSADGHGGGHTYEVMHSGRFVLIDRQWRIRAYYDGTELDVEQVVDDMRQLVR